MKKDEQSETILVIDEEGILRLSDSSEPSHGRHGLHRVRFSHLADSDVYTMFHPSGQQGAIPGSVLVDGRDCSRPFSVSAEMFGAEDDKVRVALERLAAPRSGVPADSPRERLNPLGAFVRQNGQWASAHVQIVRVRQELDSRFSGLYETGLLADKKVSVIGLGSVGAPIVDLLAKSMVGGFFLMDPDRIDPANVVRHLAVLPDIGRKKPAFMEQLVRAKNPDAVVQTFWEAVTRKNIELVRRIVQKSDLVICATDERDSRVIPNRICVEEKKPLLIVGAFTRGYGCQILYVRPFESPCYQCFLSLLPPQQEEISSARQASAIAYADHPVAIEPGLAVDLLPVSTMAAKIAIQELLRDKPTTLRSLDEDLTAPLYLWFNRREAGTDAENLRPLRCGIDGLRILRWYGVSLPQNPECPVCGDFLGKASARLGITITPEDIARFAESGRIEKGSQEWVNTL